MFVLIYSVMAGIGIGIVFFLPIACGWSFFPLVKPLVGGSILSWCSISSIMYAELAIHTLNPNNEKPTIIVPVGKGKEKYFDPNSP